MTEPSERAEEYVEGDVPQPLEQVAPETEAAADDEPAETIGAALHAADVQPDEAASDFDAIAPGTTAHAEPAEPVVVEAQAEQVAAEAPAPEMAEAEAESVAAVEAPQTEAAVAAVEAPQTEGDKPALEDIVPAVEPVEGAPAAAVAEPEPAPAPTVEVSAAPRDPNEVSIWPFVAYVGLWVAYAAVLVWQLSGLPAGEAVFESGVYRLALVGGMVLLVAGPLLTLATWFAAWGRPGSTRFGLFVSAFMKGAVSMFAGTCMWWGALVILDQMRLGKFL